MSDLNLQNEWILWNHGLNDKSWSNDSYKNIFVYQNLYDLKIYFDNLDVLQLQNSMYFIMRDSIFPTWEDKNNKNGCCASFKVPSIIASIFSSHFDINEMELLGVLIISAHTGRLSIKIADKSPK